MGQQRPVIPSAFPPMMRAVHYGTGGGPREMTFDELEFKPIPNDYEVLIKISATTVNGKDLARRLVGLYVTPAGFKLKLMNRKHQGPFWTSLGFECSGVIEEVGKNVSGWNVGDQVCALLDGRGYAEWVAVPAYNVFPAPKNLPLAHAAALPCAASIIYSYFCLRHKLTEGQKVLIHGGAGGVGSLAIQIAKHYGCKVFVTAGSQEKLTFCERLGADICINHKKQDFLERVRSETDGKGVDVILDCVGEPFFNKNISSLAHNGKLMLTGYDGNKFSARYVTVDVTELESKNLLIMGFCLQSLDRKDKSEIFQGLLKDIWPLVESGKIKPQIHAFYKLSGAPKGHFIMRKKENRGKILLGPEGEETSLDFYDLFG